MYNTIQTATAMHLRRGWTVSGILKYARAFVCVLVIDTGI